MTNKQLKNLKDTLWTTADQLRANSGLKSTEYAEPILGLIFLRFADVKYSKFEPEIKAEFNSTKGTRMERPIHEIAIEKCGFYLPEEARYDWLLNLPESEDLVARLFLPLLRNKGHKKAAFLFSHVESKKRRFCVVFSF
ncbi:MAG: type I restriction-modification system subunit M N-terminal domain-containing protein [Lachnospiraceae bacterium]|nr:MAG: type I restriction-modification system subunit M N-terminal domain-containing protein [Lachnospiraceae bacterium]